MPSETQMDTFLRGVTNTPQTYLGLPDTFQISPLIHDNIMNEEYFIIDQLIIKYQEPESRDPENLMTANWEIADIINTIYQVYLPHKQLIPASYPISPCPSITKMLLCPHNSQSNKTP